MRSQLVVLCLGWIAVVLLTWCPASHAFDEQALGALLERTRTEMEAPGLRAAVRFPDGRLVRAAVGLGDVENKIVLDDTIGMPGGSTGKTFVAALTLLLVEDGTLSLDDRASKWLGNTRWYRKLPNADSICVRHLLSHSAGISDYPGSMRWWLSMIWRTIRSGSAYFEPEELIGYALGGRAAFPVGAGYRYTDVGYLVLGRLIEAASKRTYYDLLQERVLDPLGLEHVRPAVLSALPGITPGYTGGARNLKKDGRMKFDPRSEWTGGGLVTTPTMLVEFYAALAEGRLLRRDTFAQMLDAGWRDPDHPDWHYGFGVFVGGHGRSIGHDGLWPGYRTAVRHDLRTGITVSVQTNRDGRMDLRGLARRIADRAASESEVRADSSAVE